MGLLVSAGFQGSTSAGGALGAQYLWSDNANSLEDLVGVNWDIGGGIVIFGKNGIIGDYSKSTTTDISACAIGVGAGPAAGIPFVELHGGPTVTQIVWQQKGGFSPTDYGYKNNDAMLGHNYYGDSPPPPAPAPDCGPNGAWCGGDPVR